MTASDEKRMSPLRPADLDTIHGWFNPSDRNLFAFLLQRQVDAGDRGDLVELGCYLGKSSVLIGEFVQSDESFTVLDLFESDAPEEHNTRENKASYASLTRAAFETNYQRFHGSLPGIVQAPSTAITEHVAAGSCRFVHIDASHLYEHVASDTDSARHLLQPNGIVVFDDYRSEHTPGVSAAAWEAVWDKGLRLIGLTESKMYGTWGDPRPIQDAITAWLDERGHSFCETQYIGGAACLRLKIQNLPLKAAVPPPRTSQQPSRTPPPSPAPPASSARSASPAPTTHPGLRRVAKNWLPPVVHQAISRRLRSRRT